MPQAHTRRLWRGLDRARVRRLLNSLNMIVARDEKATEQAKLPNVVVQFFGTDGSVPGVKAASTVLINRCIACLAARG